MTTTQTRTFRCDAPPEVVWEVLADHAGISAWTPIPSARLTSEGDGDRNGVGAVREFGLGVGPAFVVEEVTAFDAPTRLAYTMRRGLPVRSYVGETTLVADGDGTEVTWSITYEPSVAVLAPVLRPIVATVLRSLSDGLARHTRDAHD